MPSSSGPFYPPHWIIHRKSSDSLTPLRRSNRILATLTSPQQVVMGCRDSLDFCCSATISEKTLWKTSWFYFILWVVSTKWSLIMRTQKPEDFNPFSGIFRTLIALSFWALVWIYLAWGFSGAWETWLSYNHKFVKKDGRGQVKRSTSESKRSPLIWVGLTNFLQLMKISITRMLLLCSQGNMKVLLLTAVGVRSQSMQK